MGRSVIVESVGLSRRWIAAGPSLDSRAWLWLAAGRPGPVVIEPAGHHFRVGGIAPLHSCLFAGLRAGQRGLTAAWITTSGVISALMLTASNGGTAGHFTGTWPLPLARRSAAKTQGVGHEQDSMTHRNVRWHGTSVRSCPSHGELAQIHWQASTRCYRPHQDLATRTEPSQVRRLPVAQI
jgi:hypothetical protein